MVVPLTKMDLQKGRQVSRGKSREEKKKIVHLFLYTSEMSKGHLEEELVNAHQEVRMEKETEDRDLGVPGLCVVSRVSGGQSNPQRKCMV